MITRSVISAAILAVVVGPASATPWNASGAVATTLPAGFYVATADGGGSDSNPGTLASPFLTLTKARTAMRSSATKRTYVRAGTYQPSTDGDGCGDTKGTVLLLTTADNGVTFQYYPPDGVGSAVIDGQASGNTGLGWGVCSDANNLTVNGLYFKNFQISGIDTRGTSPLIVNNTVDNITNTARTTYGIVTVCALNGQILHNFVKNSTDQGIASYPNVAHCADNLLIANNFAYATCTAQADCGAFYIENKLALAQSGEVLRYNYCLDVYAGGGGICYYLDDGTSDVTVTSNIGRNGGTNHYDTFFVHGGSNNLFTGNILDITVDATKKMWGNQWVSGSPSGNVWANNLIVANSAGAAGYGYSCNGGATNPCGSATNGPNAYYNYGGTSIKATAEPGATADSDPHQQDDPGATDAWTYKFPSNSAVYNSPVNFPVQPSDWGTAGFFGPLGMVVAHTGTAPSIP